jgi:mono/diheme cytochrome c family protein
MKLANLRAGRLAGTSVLVAIGLALAGCAGAPPDDADLESGKQLFVSSCGACHALEDAGTNTRIGPNLDDAFRGSRQQGFDESQFAGVVEAWIERPQPPMAKDIVVGVDKENVAAYVASVAGLSPDSEIRASEPFVIRPPVPGGDAPGADPPILLPGEKTAGPQPGSEPPPEEGEGG